MVLYSWILPILIGVIATWLLLSILYENPRVKQAFSDLGALIQLQTSRPVYYGVGWMPVDTGNGAPLPLITQGPITEIGNPNPVFNYYPKTQLNPEPTMTTTTTSSGNNSNNLAYRNPSTAYDAHKAYYWALSGGYPYPYPMPIIYGGQVNMDKVRGIENKI
jgi:hypothetical protein